MRSSSFILAHMPLDFAQYLHMENLIAISIHKEIADYVAGALKKDKNRKHQHGDAPSEWSN